MAARKPLSLAEEMNMKSHACIFPLCSNWYTGIQNKVNNSTLQKQGTSLQIQILMDWEVYQKLASSIQ